MCLVAIAIIIILFILITIIEYNSIKRLQLKVQQSKSSIEIYLKERFDLIPNLVNIVKGYANYEKDLFTDIVKTRNQYEETKNLKLGEEVDNKLTQVLLRVENYPEIKANDQFLNLQENLARLENQIQAARRIYNADVTEYNTKLATIPTNIFAKIFSFKEEELLSYGNVSENINIDMNF